MTLLYGTVDVVGVVRGSRDVYFSACYHVQVSIWFCRGFKVVGVHF